MEVIRRGVSAALPLFALIFLALSLTSGASSGREDAADYVIEPEYERTLQKVVMSLEEKTKDLSNYKNIIESLPRYTDVVMLVPENRAETMKLEINEAGFAQDVKLVPFKNKRTTLNDAFLLSSGEQKVRRFRKNVPVPRGTTWAQDLFEVAKGRDGGYVILTPLIHKLFIQEGDARSDGLIEDNQFVSNLQGGGMSTLSLPIVFKGGNVLFDNHGGTRLAFVGRDVISETIMVLGKTMGQSITEEDVVRRLRRHLNVERVLVIGSDEHQPLKMFHLDQAMVLLGNGVAGVTSVLNEGKSASDDDLKEVTGFLSELRSTLKGLGYRVIDMDVTADDVRHYRYYVNGVPYINRDTKRREFLFPLFPSSSKGVNKDICLNNIGKIEALGYKVITVFTKANRRHGGIHCMVNVVS